MNLGNLRFDLGDFRSDAGFFGLQVDQSLKRHVDRSQIGEHGRCSRGDGIASGEGSDFQSARQCRKDRPVDGGEVPLRIHEEADLLLGRDLEFRTEIAHGMYRRVEGSSAGSGGGNLCVGEAGEKILRGRLGVEQESRA